MKRIIKMLFVVLPALAIMSCGQSKNESESSGIVKPGSGPEKAEVAEEVASDKGIGPVKSVTLTEEVDQEMAARGKEIFTGKCSACHKVDVKFVGPPLKDVDERRKPEWIMNMILNPEVMVAKDPVAKALLIEFNGSPMANQNLTEEEARAVLEYFRSI